MAAALRHRGPDDHGVYVDGPCALAHQRLSIIDLSEKAQQPIANEDGNIVAIVNGEIYNHIELREDLESRGHRFRSGSDSEVVVHLYEEVGDRTPEFLRGMFALVIWDRAERRLLLARDRLGQKPLFYAVRNDGLAFASELGAFIADETTELDLDLDALDAYLALQYVPAPLTIFRDIYKLRPGHAVSLTCGEQPEPRAYWDIDATPRHDSTRGGAGEREIIAEIRRRIEDAVQVRLMSDVPLGAFLSGGIDSSIVVACMARATSAPVKTFSIGFDRERDSELTYARMVAERWRTDHHEEIVHPDMVAVLPTIVRHHGEPFADPSSVPTYYLSQMTRKHVTVALSGDAGDETFGGYRRYVWAHVAHQLSRLPGPLRKTLAVGMQKLPGGPTRWVREYGAYLEESEARRYLRFVSHFSSDEKTAIYAPDLKARFASDRTAERFSAILSASRAGDPLGRLMELDLRTYLPDDIFVKVDIASMAHSLEARSPLVDHHVVEYAAGLPSSFKIRGLVGKHILKKAFADLVPEPIIKRRKKGFSTPLVRWFRGDLRDFARDTLLSQSARERGLFDMDAVGDMLARHRDGEDHGNRIWNLLCLEQWFREMIDGRSRFVEECRERVE